jgi:hypothetical protein
MKKTNKCLCCDLSNDCCIFNNLLGEPPCLQISEDQRIEQEELLKNFQEAEDNIRITLSDPENLVSYDSFNDNENIYD